MFDIPDEKFDTLLKSKIIGVGDFGAKMVDYSIAANILLGISFAVFGTSNETLLKSSAPQRIKIEDSEKSKEILSQHVAGLDLLFIFTDLEDENISIQITETAEEVLKVAILPSSALNKKNFEKFQSVIDTFVVADNENLDSMFSVVRCIRGLLTAPIIITGIDFADVSTILKNGGRAYVAHGKAKGENAIIDAAKMATDSIKDILANSKRILLGFFGEKEHLRLSFPEINKASIMIQDATFKDACIMWAIADDVTDFNTVEVIIIATDNFNS